MPFPGFAGKLTPAELVRVPMARHSALYKDPEGRSGARHAPLAREARTLWGGAVQAYLHRVAGGGQLVARLDWTSPWSTVLLDALAEDAVATCTFLLEVYEPDRETVAWAVSTDALHENPYLMLPANYAQQEVDVVTGAVTIGQVEVAVVDKAQLVGDQDSGWLTERLSEEGVGAIHGRRCRLTMPVDSEGNRIVLADGPAAAPRMDASYSAYRWAIRDTRETERKLRAFGNGGSTIIMPPGVLGGFGLPGSQLVGEPTPMPATFRAHRVNAFFGRVPTAYFDLLVDEPFTEVMREALQAVEEPERSHTTVGDWFHEFEFFFNGAETITVRRWRYPNVNIYWRDAGSADEWSIMYNLFEPTLIYDATGEEAEADSDQPPGEPPLLLELDVAEEFASRIRLPAVPAGDGIETGVFGFENAHLEWPEDDQAVEVILVHGGNASEQYPLHVSGITTGELLRRLYAGEYSRRHPVTGAVVPTGIRYDEEALAQMTDPVLLRLTEPVEDIRDWAERHVYAPTGWFPAIDQDGRISPLSQEPPPSSAGLPRIDNTVAAPSPSWNAGESVVNVLRFTYRRYYLPAVPDEDTGADGVSTREVVLEFRDEESIRLHDEQLAEYDALVSSAVGTQEGELDTSGDFEPGRAQALDRKLYVLDRFRQAAQLVSFKARRNAVPDLRAGEWILLDLSWLPDYVLRRRGAQFIGQVVSIADEDCAWRGLTVEEALPVAES